MGIARRAPERGTPIVLEQGSRGDFVSAKQMVSHLSHNHSLWDDEPPIP